MRAKAVLSDNIYYLEWVLDVIPDPEGWCSELVAQKNTAVLRQFLPQRRLLIPQYDSETKSFWRNAVEYRFYIREHSRKWILEFEKTERNYQKGNTTTKFALISK